jgi:Sperm-tail PG-rich repeat
MGEKFNNTEEIKRAKAVPGPGSYDIESGKFVDSNKINEPQIRIGTASRMSGSISRGSLRTPGPGNYNTIEAASTVRRQSP